VIRVDHALELVKLGLSERLDKGLAIIFSHLLFTTNVSATLYVFFSMANQMGH
jgi:hypothetical protein